jgi:parallel beta-helix repeat protein
MKSEVGIAAVLGLAVSLWSGLPAQAATSVSSCPVTITAPGAYVVTKDLTCSGDAITIAASNVDLDLGGHTLSGDGSGDGIHVQGASPVYNVSIHRGTVQRFADGIFLGFFALNCTISSVTASQNTDIGIFLSHANGNTVLGNTISQTGAGNGTGISLDASNGNTVTGNTASGNYAGIDVSDNSTGNTVSRNTATANRGQGIRLLFGATQNTIQENTCSGNGTGISVGAFGNDGVNQNTIQNNTVSRNFLGILVEQNCSGNTLQGNTVMPSFDVDVEDDSPGCDSNHWLNNRFVTFRVAGGSDGGCLLGQPNGAQLMVIGGGPPNNLAPGSCLTLALKVRFAGRSDYLDVTSWSETSFSAPGHGTVTGNQLCVGPGDANTSFTVYGRYTDPVSGVSSTGTVSVHVHK